MELQTFRIWKYRNIDDSGEIELLDPLTCIVGKNQSGKTALLRALHKFNPHDPDPYVLNREWPRGERLSRDVKQVVCEVRFLLSDPEREELANITSQEMQTSIVVVSKDYGGHFEIRFPEQADLFPDALHPNSIDQICSDFPSWPQPVGEPFVEMATECIEEVQRLAKEGRFGELETLQQRQVERLQASISNQNPHQQHENQFISQYSQKLQQIRKNLSEERTMHQRAIDYVVGRIPTFIYMADYWKFSGTADLDELKQRRDSKKQKLSESDQTFLMILGLSGLDLDRLITQGNSDQEGTLHERQLDLQDGAKTLTRSVAGRWGQNPYEIQFRADGQRFFTDIEEVGKDVGMIPLEEQSTGFQWFFSFDLRFMHDSEATFQGCVLLLDEPGLHLHPGGQDDLLKRLDAYAANNTLIYTTHLPFLVDLREPKRIKVIKQTDRGAIVSDDLGSSQRDEKLTLQAALGMRARQNYLISQRNLTVEGPQDQWLICELSSLLERSGGLGLPEEVMVTACGGAPEVVHWTTFMVGQELQVVALFDSDPEGRAQEEKLRTSWLTRYKETRSGSLLIGDAMKRGAGAWTIEDLFPDSYYLTKTQESHREKLRGVGKVAEDIQLKGSGPLLARIEAAIGPTGVLFNKGSVGKVIRREIAKMRDVAELPEGVAERARNLFAAIRASFGDD